MFFSDREGYRHPRDTFQVDSIDIGLRNRLWNTITGTYFERIHGDDWKQSSSDIYMMIRRFYTHYLKLTDDDIPARWHDVYNDLRYRYMNSEWFVVYDFVEHIVGVIDTFVQANATYASRNQGKLDRFIQSCNSVLEEEMSAWRLVDKSLVRLTSREEIEAVEQALALEDVLLPARTQLAEALRLMSLRPTPNYRDSIKHSISAVETVCKLITKQPGATIGQALKTIEQRSRIALHTDLNEGFQKLYQWTNDASGVRHNLMVDYDLDYIDAQYMLVSCAAFINYLIAKSTKANIVLS